MDILIGCIILAAAAASVKCMINRKKKGKMLSCGGDCSRCLSACGERITKP
ncbi:MAG: FeoB-associated Cys-rich membrane protein [Lachnospiraceae bacterium]|nr:FeoB-associated Cys-rich membrane protein [Lachnospiraceae bacterium]